MYQRVSPGRDDEIQRRNLFTMTLAVQLCRFPGSSLFLEVTYATIGQMLLLEYASVEWPSPCLSSIYSSFVGKNQEMSTYPGLLGWLHTPNSVTIPSVGKPSNTQGSFSYWLLGNITKLKNPRALSSSQLPAVSHLASCFIAMSYRLFLHMDLDPALLPERHASQTQLQPKIFICFKKGKALSFFFSPPGAHLGGNTMVVLFLSLQSPMTLSSLTSNSAVWTQAELGLFSLTLTLAALSLS